MEIEEDDLPDGYPDVWGITVGHLREERQKGRGRKTHARPVVQSEEARAANRERQRRWFAKLGPTDDWEENRRIYNRRRDPRGRMT